MLSRDALRDLFLHMEWADADVWRAVVAADAARDDAPLSGLLLHLHAVQRAFLDVWKQRPVTRSDAQAFPEIAGLRRWAEPYYGEAREFLDSFDAAALARPVVMPWAGEFATQLGRRLAMPTLAETMFHLTSHSTYHRGQVNARLRVIGGEPPLVDYIAWI